MKNDTTGSKPPQPQQSARTQLLKIGKTLERYTTLWFALLLAVVYGFVLFRIQAAQSAQPTDSDIAAQVQSTATPHVDPKVVNEMLSLQDHSVNVKALFDQARSNPFNE